MISDERLARLVANEADMAYKRRVMLFLRWLDAQPHDTILDAACGRGFVLNFVRATSDCTLVGQDIEYRYVRQAHTQLSDLVGGGDAPAGSPEPVIGIGNGRPASAGFSRLRPGLLNGDLCHLPFASHSFDKVILAEVLEHLPDDRTGLAEAVRVTRPGGLMLISVPNANYPFWWDPINKTWETLFGIHIARGPFAGIWANHVRLYTLDKLLALVEGAGLQVEEIRHLVHYCFPFIHNIVYGLGKPLLESGALPAGVARAASRYHLDGRAGSRLNPVNVGLWLFNRVDRLNDRLDEETLRRVSTMNICLKVRVPLGK